MRTRDLVVAAALVAAGVWFTVVWALGPTRAVAYDVYSYYVPNVLYTLDRVRAGGMGLLWNPFQNCGQPSLGISSTGPLYPLNLFFVFLPLTPALFAVTVAHFVAAGIGMYLLAREIGAGRVAAGCGALAFELGAATVDLTTWGPQMSGSYVWMPLALLFCERLLRIPSLRDAVGLGVALTLPLLTGFPQVVVFIYQLVALRVLFEFATRRVPRPWPTLGTIGLGLGLAPLLDAVQLVPGTEMAVQSVRGGPLSLTDLTMHSFRSWSHFAQTMATRRDLFNPLVVVPAVVAGASGLRRATRRSATFYALAGALYLVLALGPATPLFDLYLALPLGRLFREPPRFVWVTSFCLAVLTALGADAIIRASHRTAWKRWSAVAVTVAALLGLNAVIPKGLLRVEWILGAIVVAGALLAAIGGGWSRVGVALLVAALTFGLASFPTTLLPAMRGYEARRGSPRSVLPDDAVLFRYAGSFDALRARMTAQERIYIVNQQPSFALMPKSASLFGVPTIQDYEPQPSYRSAAYTIMLRTGQQLRSLNQYYYPGVRDFLPAFRKRLLDLAAARYVVVDAKVDNAHVVAPPLLPIAPSPDGEVVVYENRQALPRASFVPAVSVVSDASWLLQRLAYGTDDPRQVALLEESPPSGFYGAGSGRGGGSAEIAIDQPERVVVRVHAPARGFLHLADQYFPGWRATVNGEPAPILRANYLFRAVEVPAGESTVEFRYRPTSVRVGAAITFATLLSLIILALRRLRAA